MSDSFDRDDQGTSEVALVIIDMINDLEFPGGDEIFEQALKAAGRIAELKKRADAAAIPVIFANDNFGRWRSDFREAIRHCGNRKQRGHPLVDILNPTPDDYFVLKPQHSAFFATPLELLLRHLGSRRLVLCGISGDMCVKFTACDAYMRELALAVPADCTASQCAVSNQRALEYMAQTLNADIRNSADLEFPDGAASRKNKNPN